MLGSLGVAECTPGLQRAAGVGEVAPEVAGGSKVGKCNGDQTP